MMIILSVRLMACHMDCLIERRAPDPDVADNDIDVPMQNTNTGQASIVFYFIWQTNKDNNYYNHKMKGSLKAGLGLGFRCFIFILVVVFWG